MEALKTIDVHKVQVQTVEKPKPKAEEVLIKNHAVTLNPTDWKHAYLIAEPGVIVGCDFAGEVIELGSSVSNDVKVGDRVSGFVHGGKYPDKGSFAQFLTAKAASVMKIPSNLNDSEGASIGVAAETAVQALFQRLELTPPAEDASTLPKVDKNSPKLLVWSGSTAVGSYAVQLGRIAGYYVITTASPKNHANLRELGAQEVYDYRDESVPEKISHDHPDLKEALDCISENGTQSLCARSLGTSGGKICVLLKPEKEALELRNDVKIIHTLLYSSLGETFAYGKRAFEADEVKTDFEYMKQWLNGNGKLSKLFASGLLKPLKIKEMTGGLHGIQEGLDYLKEGKASGEKLAYTI